MRRFLLYSSSTSSSSSSSPSIFSGPAFVGELDDDDDENRRSKVCWARKRGLMKMWARREGEMSLPGPTRILLVARTCWMPFSVRESSVVPV